MNQCPVCPHPQSCPFPKGSIHAPCAHYRPNLSKRVNEKRRYRMRYKGWAYVFLLVWSVSVLCIVATEGRHHAALKILGLCFVAVVSLFGLSREMER